MSRLGIESIQTKTYLLNQDFDLFLLEALKNISLENKILAITSKLVSLGEKAIIDKNKISKFDLIKESADQYIGETVHQSHLTIKNHLLVPSAGIDESNCEGDFYILLPKNPFQSAKRIYQLIKNQYHLEKFGIILTDSHSIPMRKGVIGSSIAFWGFNPLDSKVGHDDLFNRKIQMTSRNLVDMLSSAAVLCMGETNESTPMALIDYKGINFSDKDFSKEFFINPQDDLILNPLLKHE